MKKTALKELRTKTAEERGTLLSEKKKEFAKIKLDVLSGRIKNTRLIFNTKKDIAKIQTVINEKSVQE